MQITHYPLATVHADPPLLARLAALTLERGTMHRQLTSQEDLADRHVWVAREEGIIAGWALRFPKLRETVVMAYHHFYVDPPWRRRGVGTALARAAAAFDHGGAQWRTFGTTPEGLAFFLKFRASGFVSYMDVMDFAPTVAGDDQ